MKDWPQLPEPLAYGALGVAQRDICGCWVEVVKVSWSTKYTVSRRGGGHQWKHCPDVGTYFAKVATDSRISVLAGSSSIIVLTMGIPNSWRFDLRHEQRHLMEPVPGRKLEAFRGAGWGFHLLLQERDPTVGQLENLRVARRLELATPS